MPSRVRFPRREKLIGKVQEWDMDQVRAQVAKRG